MNLSQFTTLISPRQLSEALLQKQLFPSVKSRREELPPFFTSASFSYDIAMTLSQCQPRSAPGVTFRTRRFDGLVRQMGVPHPVPYSRLILQMEARWGELELKLDSCQSMVAPSSLHNDGRVLIMDYGSTHKKTLKEIQAAQSQRYHVSADVSNFFPSVYSHAIDWALRGFASAKNGVNDGSWQSLLDECVRNCHNGETKGVMIGPAVFNIISELILQEVDRNLSGRGFQNFVRYVDDYSAYFLTLEESEEFLQVLDRGLASFRLQLNTRKTKITPMGSGFGEAWIGEIARAIPKRRSGIEAIHFLQYCERLAIANPERSVLTYGVKALLSRLKCPEIEHVHSRKPKRDRDLMVLHELLRIGYLNPHILPLIAQQASWCSVFLSRSEKDAISRQVLTLLMEACRRRETDMCLWSLYIIRVLLKSRITADQFSELIGTEDDLILLACAITSEIGKRRAVEYAKSLNGASKFDLEEHWLLRYELFRCKYLTFADLDTNVERTWFQPARKDGLAFSVLPVKKKSSPRRSRKPPGASG